MVKTLILMLVVVVSACSFRDPIQGTGGRSPQAGHFYCVTNVLPGKGDVFAEQRFRSGQLGLKGDYFISRTIEVKHGVQAGKRVCFRWPWVKIDTDDDEKSRNNGRIILIASTDTVRGAWFNPWPENKR